MVKRIVSIALAAVISCNMIFLAAAESAQGEEQEYQTVRISAASQPQDTPDAGEGAVTAAPELNSTDAASVKVTAAAKNAAAVRTVKLTQNIVLYKGEKRTLDVVGVKNGKPTVKTSNKKIVAVSGLNITAKKSGKAKVTVTVKSGKNTYIVNVNVTVKVSSYDSSISYKATKDSNKHKAAALVWHKAVKAGNSFDLKMTGYDKVTFTSTDKSIASVTAKGRVTARKKGTALIKAKVKAGKQSYTFYTKVHVYSEKAAPVITQSEIDKFFGSSGFVGSSIGEGQQMYFNSMGYNYLGHPKMMVKNSYAFHNDEGANGARYQVGYGSYTGPARYVIQYAGVKRVFIHMGTNDMMGSADYVFGRYVDYLAGIRAVNPKVPIYVEAMTPVYPGGEKGYLNNATVDALNSKLKAYCKKQSDIYFIDVNTPLKGGTSGMLGIYSSDNYVHITAAGYRVWTETLIEYIKKQLIAEQRAKDAVKTYTESKLAADKKAAKKYVDKLEASSLKTSLLKKLKK